MGRGVLADGVRADQPGTRAVQRARECDPRPCGGRGEVEREDPGDRRRRRRSSSSASTTGWCKTSLPGQYVTVKVLMPDGVQQPRQYSLTRADDGEHRQFSVKRVRGGGKPDGEVSNAAVRVGGGRRRPDDVTAVRRRRARRLGSPGGLRQRRHRGHPDGGDAVASRRGRVAPAHHAPARRPGRGVVRAAPADRRGHPLAAERAHARLVRARRRLRAARGRGSRGH